MKNDIPTIIHAALFGFTMNGVIWRIDAGQLDNIIFPAVIAVSSATIMALRIRLNSPPNVKEHETLSAGASVDHGVEVETTGKHVNRAADRGCVSRLIRWISATKEATTLVPTWEPKTAA